MKTFINNHIGKVKSAYTGDLVNHNWEREMENGGIQELADFAMTCYYSPEEEIGLSYDWDELLAAISMLSTTFEPDYYILGHTLESEIFKLDPGGMGIGFIYAEDIAVMHNELINLKQSFIDNGMPKLEDVVYEIAFPELIEAYEELILIYNQAEEINCGLLITF
ncbi:hypothetical protein LOR37_12875 [Clostridium estertheticum]|uniref:hypothetical protein n=1 Tax=Clostridium estertheticum TaxID=238834 RepID=UPI0022DD07FE|nr:hypothetical protein [Clostridium estertheticum]WBL45591.1 hypothetical protein LOR37_12875 [Clostridium estertheticum]